MGPVRLLRRRIPLPKRDDLWDTVEQAADVALKSGDDNGQASAGAFMALLTWRGTAQGNALELAYVTAFTILAVTLAMLPIPSRVNWLVDGRLVSGIMVRWLSWAFVVGSVESDVD